MKPGQSLFDFPIHLGRGATAVAQPQFTGMDWYAGYDERHGDDLAEGRLVSLFRFEESWTSWEMHPAGDELVLCTAGTITLHQEIDQGGAPRTVTLEAGQAVVNRPGVWHTADVDAPATALFITAGAGTEVRPRSPR